MSREIDKDIVIKHKKAAIKQLNSTFEKLINSSDTRKLKKADLIAYWVEDYSRYLNKETNFDYSKIMRYRRGDIIQVNFGFNIGSEQGGLHYAVVMDNDNKKNSPVVTVIPLSSGTEKDVYARDLFLGNELYEKVKAKYDKLDTKIKQDLDFRKQMLKVVKQLQEKSDDTLDESALSLIENYKIHTEKLEAESHRLKVYKKEVEKLKRGSIALMEQITTISKMRIYRPKNSDDLLYKVKYSSSTMDKINNRLVELFVFKG